MIDLDDVRALARSSPWRWRTLVFTLEHAFARHPVYPPRLRAFVRRPAGLRVERIDGTVLAAEWRSPPPLVAGDEQEEPLRRQDGLVARRPARVDDPYCYDDPMFQSYQWVAMLHPFELADGVELDEEGAMAGLWTPDLPPISASTGPAEVDHHGRPALEVTVATTEHYAARCSCCPLLDGLQARRMLALEGWERPLDGAPEAFRIRLDRQTGVLVQLTEVGGRSRLGDWRMIIERVDMHLPRDLFGRA